MKTTCTKKFVGFPFAHRQHTHDGHCALIHGHNWDFTFTFACNELNPDGFVIDFGKLKWLKEWLEDKFDHTLVLNEDDPVRVFLQLTLAPRDGHAALAKIVVVPNGSAEGLAKWVMHQVNKLLQGQPVDGHAQREVWVTSVVCAENERNSATVSDQ